MSARLRSALLFAGFFVLILGARWTWVGRFGMELPYMDQWDGEARTLLIPWSHGVRSPALFWQPHNEHRIALTRAQALILTLANRQWDQRLECVANAFLAAGLAAGYLVFVARRWGRGWTAGWALLLGALFGLPASWENMIRGFDSQQFFLLDLAVGALAAICLPKRPARGLWLALACAVLSLGSMASGAVIAVPLALVILARMRGNRELAGVRSVGLVCCGAVFALGALTQTHVAGHDVLRAHSPAEFVSTFVNELGWPASFHGGGPAAALLLWLPFAALARGYFRRSQTEDKDDRAALFALALGVWTLLQMAATAYARSEGGAPPATRYLDLLYLGLIANGLCAVLLLRGCRYSPGRIALAAAWALLLARGFGAEVRSAWRFLNDPAFASEYRYEEANVRDFVLTGDPRYLNHAEIPYPDQVLLGRYLSDPAIRRLLPASVRPPLALASPAATASPPAPVPPLDHLAVHIVEAAPHAAAASWRSHAAMASLGGWLSFPVAGELGSPGTTLRLRDDATGAVTPVEPARLPGGSWHAAYVRAPAHAFTVEARCAPGRWFAFGDPVEMGGLSHLAWRAARRGPVIAFGGLALLALALGWPGSGRAGISRAPASR